MESGQKQLAVVPITIPAIEAASCIYLSVLQVSCRFANYLGVWQDALSETPERDFYFVVFGISTVFLIGMFWRARMYIREMQAVGDALKQFKVRDTQCFSELDRRFVYETIVALYETLDSFEVHVQTVFSGQVQDVIGSAIFPSYWMLVRSICLPWLISVGSIGAAYVQEAVVGDSINWVLMNCVQWLLIFPVFLRFSWWKCTFCLHTKTKTLEFMFCVGCSITCGGSFAIMCYLLRYVFVGHLAIRAAADVLGSSFAFFMYRPRMRPLRTA